MHVIAINDKRGYEFQVEQESVWECLKEGKERKKCTYNLKKSLKTTRRTRIHSS